MVCGDKLIIHGRWVVAADQSPVKAFVIRIVLVYTRYAGKLVGAYGQPATAWSPLGDRREAQCSEAVPWVRQAATGMDKNQLDRDKSWAQEICQALRAGNPQPLATLVASYQQILLPFARRRLFHPQDVEDVLQNFWAELLNAKAICWYARQNGDQISLRNYCLGLLYRRIIDRNRQIARDRHHAAAVTASAANPGDSPEHLLSQSISDELARRLVHGALLRLAAQSPRDAELVRWHLEGLSYEDMATRRLEPGPVEAAARQRKINALKKQFTRQKSGSLARFREILLELMRAQGLSYDDF